MTGRIQRPERNSLALPEIGRLHIGKKALNKYGKEYPTAVDYFIPTGKYAEQFLQSVGDKESTIQIVFPSDNPEQVCNERYEYRDTAGALVARGDGENFEVWNGKKYQLFTIEEHPDLMERISAKYPKPKRNEEDNGWDIALTLRFIIPSVRGVIGVWGLTTKGQASSIKNIRNSFDAVQQMRGSVMQSVFDLSVQFAKSNKPNTSSKYPVLCLVCNDGRIEEIRQSLAQKNNLSLLLPNQD